MTQVRKIVPSGSIIKASAISKPSASSTNSTPANRPIGREKQYGTGGGNVYKRGSGLGGGPVGSPSLGNAATPHPAFSSTYTAPSASSAESMPAGRQSPLDFTPIKTKLSELLQRQAEMQAAKETKQTELNQAKQNASTVQKNLIQEREQTRLRDMFYKMQADLARKESQSSSESTPYSFLPIQQLRLAVPGKSKDWMEHADIKNLSEDMKNLSGIISLLPDSFPTDEFDNMTPKQQLAIVQRTDLTREEQWALLNARTNVKALSEVMQIQENRLYYGLSQTQADELCQQLLEIDKTNLPCAPFDCRMSVCQSKKHPHEERGFSVEEQKNRVIADVLAFV